MGAVVEKYLDLLDAQRESALSALEGITDSQLWQRPAPKEWSIGEILDHNYLLIASMYPIVERMWRFWVGTFVCGKDAHTQPKSAIYTAIRSFRNGWVSCGRRVTTPASRSHPVN